MKLSENTITILKNFSTINQSLQFRVGTAQRTVSAGKSILANATIAEDIPREFAIYDLSRLLGALSLFDNPEVECEDAFLNITSGRNRIKFTYADPSVITSESKQFTMPPTFLSFNIEKQGLDLLNKAAAVLKTPDVAITYDATSSQTLITACDVKNPNADVYTLEPETFEVQTTGLVSCKIVFNHENLKLIPGTYKISLGLKGKIVAGRFENQTMPVVYHIASDPNASELDAGQPATV